MLVGLGRSPVSVVSTNWVHNLFGWVALHRAFCDVCVRENRTHGEKRPCVRHPDYLYTYFVDTTLVLGSARPSFPVMEKGSVRIATYADS